MGPLYKKYISSGINQNSEVPNKNAAGETQNDVMNRKGQAFKKAETNFNTLRKKFEGFNFNKKTEKQFNSADSSNVVKYNDALKAFNKSGDSINKVNEDYANSVLNPESGTPLLQGAYERGDAYVEDYAGNALMQGLQTLGANVARQFNDPMNKSNRQKNRVERRNKRSDKKFPDGINSSPEELAKFSKFNKKTTDIEGRSIANERKATIDSRYKEWLISNKRKGDEDLPPVDEGKIDNGNIDPKTGKPYVGALTAEQKQAKIDAANAVKNINL